MKKVAVYLSKSELKNLIKDVTFAENESQRSTSEELWDKLQDTLDTFDAKSEDIAPLNKLVKEMELLFQEEWEKKPRGEG